MNRILLVMVGLALLVSQVFATTFPINIEDCLIKAGRVEITGWFNQVRYDDNDGTTRLHKAIDIPCVLGTKIVATTYGEVIGFGFDRPKYCRKTKRWKSGYGNYVKIKDSNGLIHIYAHLSKYEVRLNQTINEGQVFAYAGSTGMANSVGKYRFGNHLHYEVRNKYGKKIYYTKKLGDAIKPFLRNPKGKYAFKLR